MNTLKLVNNFSDGHPMMVSGSVSGHIAIWDLEKRKLHSYLNEAHSASVTGLSCLPSEPLMVTSAADNSLKVSHESFHIVKMNCLGLIALVMPAYLWTPGSIH